MHTHQKVLNAVVPTSHAHLLESPVRVQSTDQVNSNGQIMQPGHVIRSRPIVWHKWWGDVLVSVLSGGQRAEKILHPFLSLSLSLDFLVL